MEGSENNNDNDSNIIKKFLLEISGKFKSSSIVEFSNYEEALESFNQHSKSGKNLILYEIHKSTLDGSVVKKVPVLNTSKHAERMRILEEEARINSELQNDSNAQSNQQSSSKQKNKMTWANMKFKVILLAAVVGGLILILFLLDFLASGGNSSSSMGGHFIGYEAFQNYVQSSIDEIEINHPQLVSIFFLL
ncbi:hypothetical protein [Candidatus Nitrosocosmicus hydrocola]|uniref:hypothetical protein n=1 Tax=Candidatus Nitrosocosmicus hydrocola TaxID=1826872 RepID=UPI0011E5A9B6|nr:hypothetical protein [Candidatus Nitrosocosmicus hydrocola]